MTPARFLYAAIFALLPASASADNYEGYRSSIEGVGLWWLHPGDAKVIRRLTFGDNPEFALYCDGTNRIFIFERGSEGFVCNTEEVFEVHAEGGDGEQHNRVDRHHLSRLVARAQKDKEGFAAQSVYHVSLLGLKLEKPEIFTISKRPLARAIWTTSAPTRAEHGVALRLARENLSGLGRYEGHEYKTIVGYDDNQIAQLWKEKSPTESYTLKISVEKVDIILAPTLFEYEATSDTGNIVFSVIARDADGARFIDHVRGCLSAVGADLDGDAVPELIFRHCDQYGGTDIRYTKIYPTVKALISYEHN